MLLSLGPRTVLALCTGTLLFQAVAGEAQQVRGFVACLATPSGVPVGSALVSVGGTLVTVRSAPSGCIELPSGITPSRLRVRRLGYRPLDLDVPPDHPRGDTLRIEVQPSVTELAPTLVNGAGSTPLVTSIGTESLRQLPALGERDAFRVLPFAPGISQPNDILSRVHLAGGASDEHGITLDGHPLQAPFHINQVFGAVNPSSLERVDVSMHHLPASRADRLSGSIDMVSRQADSLPAREAQLSVLSAGASIVQPNALGVADVALSVRSSYLDGLLRVVRVADDQGGDDLRVPSFRDALVSARRTWRSGWRVDALGFYTEDRWFKSSGLSANVPPTWGEHLLGVRASYSTGSWCADFRASHDRAFAETRRAPLVGSDSSVIPRLGDITIDQRWTSVAAGLSVQRQTWRASGGMVMDWRAHDNSWFGPDVPDLLNATLPASAAYVANQSQRAAHLEVVRAFRWFTMTAGVRGTHVGTDRVFAPRLLISAPLSSTLDLSLSANRRVQFDAIIDEPREGSITQPVFFVPTPRVADVTALSSTWRPRQLPGQRRIQATATIYGRRQRNVPVFRDDTIAAPAPTSVPAFEPQFQLTSGSVLGAAFGVDVATESGWLLQGSYTRQRVQDRRTGALRPVPWDAPHQLVGIVGVPFGGHFQLTVAQQLRSGTAITPIKYRLFVPTPFGSYAWRLIPGEPLSARRPNFLRTDVGVQGAWRALGRRWIASVQVVNALYRTNGLDQSAGALIACSAPGAQCEYDGATRRGLPIIPSIGLEVRW